MNKKIYYCTLLVLILFNCTLQSQNLIQYVDSEFGVNGKGNCVIGPQLPFGSTNPSPDTPEGNTDGYNKDEKIIGFSQLHVSGTGGPSKYGQFLLSPQIGLDILENKHLSGKSEEEAKVAYYKVRLDKYDILCEFSPTEHATIYNFTYPKSDSASLLIDLGHNIPGDIMHRGGESRGGYAESGFVQIDKDDGFITGYGSYWGGWSAEPFSVYFALEFNKAVKTVGTWKDSTISVGKDKVTIQNKAERIGAFIGFNTEKDEQITVKIAVSFKSIENAKSYLKNEIPDWDIAQVRKNAEDVWNKRLSKILIKTDSEVDKKIFYSSLYRTMQMPRDRTLDNPKWNSTLPYWDDQYCLWDTWKTAYPLHLLINESMVRDNILAFIDRYKHNGQVLDAFIAGNDKVFLWDRTEQPYYFGNQGGDNVDNVIADAYVKQIDGIDWEQAYEILSYNAEKSRTPAYLINDRGWLPFRSYEYAFDCSRTIEFAYNDFCASQVAKGLNKKEDYKKYYSRSSKWKNLWNENLTDDGFNGFLCPRRMNGTWLNFNPKNNSVENSPGHFDRSFYEGDSWNYSYILPHDFYSVIDLMGGKEKYVERLQHVMENDMIDLWNEPAFLTPFSFIYAGRPDLTSYWVRDNFKRYDFEKKSFPGDDDSGAMSSWYVFASMGFFPNAGQDIYLVSGPLFPYIEINRENGSKIIIETENYSKDNIYVKALTLNGKSIDRAWIKHHEIANGAHLKFTMDSKPSDWGKKNTPPNPSAVH